MKLCQRTMFAALAVSVIAVGSGRADEPPGKAKPAIPELTPPSPQVTSEPVVSEPETTAKPRKTMWNVLHPVAAHKAKKAQMEPDEVRVGCYAHFNDYTCGSFKSDFVFMFSGCRQFFGERCIKAPPPFPVEGFDRNWLYPNGVPPQKEKKKFGGLFGGGCRDCQ